MNKEVKEILAQDIFFENNLKDLLTNEVFEKISRDNLKLLLESISNQVDKYNSSLNKIVTISNNYKELCQKQNKHIDKLTSDLSIAYDNIELLLDIIKTIAVLHDNNIPDKIEDIIVNMFDIINQGRNALGENNINKDFFEKNFNFEVGM